MLASRRRFYGYISAFCGFLVYMLTVGSYYSLTIGAGTMAKDLGWTSAQTSVAFSLFMLMNLGSPLYGSLIARFGPRKVMIGGSLLAAAGWAGVATTNSLLQFYLATIPIGIGVSAASMLSVGQIVGNWFYQRRTLVMGLAMTAGEWGG